MQTLKNNQSHHQQKKPQLSSEAFPALSSSSAPSAPPQWITVSKNKEKQRVIKTEPPPAPRQPAFNTVADFPTLPQNGKPKTKKTQPPPPVNNEPPKPSKKEKKKQNSKKENIAEVPLVNGLDKKFMRDPAFDPTGMNSERNVVADKKIKTIDTVSATVNNEKQRNGSNGDFSLASKDYPPLAPRSENGVPTIITPTPAKPLMSKKIANGTVQSGIKSRPACDGMTFTNSAGQTFPAPVHAYIPPPDFEQRNRALVKKFQVALGGPEAVEDFKVASRAFRDSIISAEEFYQHCHIALGSQFDSVFTDLVALLPDIAKQQELVVGRDIKLDVCVTCGQLLAPGDRIAHDTAHWPPLAPR